MIGAIISGAFTGWIASKIMKVKTGLLLNIVIGIIGSFIGGIIFSAIGFVDTVGLAKILSNVVGACAFIGISSALFR